MNVIIVATVVALASVLTLVALVTLLITIRRKRSPKYDRKTSKEENEILVNKEIEISHVIAQSTVQPLPQKEPNEEDKIVTDDNNVHGYLYFTLKYDEKRSLLVVKLIKGENIPVHKSYPSKPYVEVFVVPASTKPLRGKEGLEFHIASDELFRQTIHFCIYRYDKFSRKTTIGDVFLSVAELRANEVKLNNEVFMKNKIEPSIELNIHAERSAKDLWDKLRNAVRSGKFIRQLKRRSFVERLEWETGSGDAAADETEQFKLGSSYEHKERKESVKDEGPLGKLLFSLKFDEKRSVLLIRLMKAIDITDDNGQPPSVMVEGSLLSGTESLAKPFTTSVQHATFMPVFEEVFEYNVDIEELWKLKIRFMVWYVDSQSQLTSLGEVVYFLSNLDIEGFNIAETAMLFSKEIIHLNETRDSPSKEEPSKILFSLTYLPATNRLVVLVLKAKDLKTTHDCPGVYVEVLVLHRNLRYRKSTSFKSETSNPVFNEALFFDLKDVIIGDVKLQLIVYQKETTAMSSAIPLGKLHLGKGVGGGGEESHWTEALTAAKPTAQWHNLHPVQYVKPRVQSISPMRTKEIRPSFGFPKPRR